MFTMSTTSLASCGAGSGLDDGSDASPQASNMAPVAGVDDAYASLLSRASRAVAEAKARRLALAAATQGTEAAAVAAAAAVVQRLPPAPPSPLSSALEASADAPLMALSGAKRRLPGDGDGYRGSEALATGLRPAASSALPVTVTVRRPGQGVRVLVSGPQPAAFG